MTALGAPLPLRVITTSIMGAAIRSSSQLRALGVARKIIAAICDAFSHYGTRWIYCLPDQSFWHNLCSIASLVEPEIPQHAGTLSHLRAGLTTQGLLGFSLDDKASNEQHGPTGKALPFLSTKTGINF